jgi:hypothetical protein
VANFVDDDELPKQHDREAKQHHLDKLCGAFSSLKPTEADPAAERHNEAKSTKVNIEIAELQNESDEVGLDPIPP